MSEQLVDDISMSGLDAPPLTQEDFESLAYFLLAKREECSVISDPSKLFPLRNVDEVYEIHKYMAKTMSTLGKHIGWKCGACDEAAWKRMGLMEPFRAPLFSRRIYDSPSEVNKAGDNVFLLEAEFAFMLGKSLPPRENQEYTTAEVWDAVSLIAPAIEIVGSRWSNTIREKALDLQVIADGGVNVGAALGRGIRVEQARRDLDAVDVSFIVNGDVAVCGSGAKVLGHPITSLTWLANHLCKYGVSTQDSKYGGSGPGLAKGDIVMSGACCMLFDFNAGDEVIADFSDFGQVKVSIKSTEKPKSKL